MQVPEYTLLVRNSLQSRMGKLINIFVFGAELLEEKELAVMHVAFTEELSVWSVTTKSLWR